MRPVLPTCAVTLALVIMVIFLFLRNASATLIPAIALPISIGGAFSVMYVLHYSLDNLSMMALILSVGFVVDDAIVMLENIVRHLERGEKPMQAALNGSREVGFTIVSMTLSLAAVFIPVLFMAGILGRLFREFAVTLCVAIPFAFANSTVTEYSQPNNPVAARTKPRLSNGIKITINNAVATKARKIFQASAVAILYVMLFPKGCKFKAVLKF